jgi:tRNA pseudouridine32 synthase / 23S rRNA pseudouridine746 synthase
VSVYAPPQGKVSYIHTDPDLIVIDKPAELLSVPGRGPEKADCAISRVQADHPEALTVHRLDMSTSGLLVFARSKEAQRRLAIQFEKGVIAKSYIAHVWGAPDPGSGLIDLPLGQDWPNRPRQKVDHDAGKPSQTQYETSGTHAHGARLALTPLTGRTHQLRLHLAAIGHPILGDDIYAHAEALTAKHRLHLHALRLELIHPTRNERLRFESACPF